MIWVKDRQTKKEIQVTPAAWENMKKSNFWMNRFSLIPEPIEPPEVTEAKRLKAERDANNATE